jgi:hypothetical protein
MNQMLKQHQSELLREVISKHCPELADRMESADISGWNREDRRAVINALGRELMASGLDKDCEPTPRGLQIENLIDIVNRPNIKK